jgi:predicted secreted Zn-dependent protease
LLRLVLAVAEKKTIKFHGLEVDNVIVQYSQKTRRKTEKTIEEFNAANDPQACETVNVQVVSEFVTVTFYKDEKANSIIKRELIPTCKVEHILVKDMPA